MTNEYYYRLIIHLLVWQSVPRMTILIRRSDLHAHYNIIYEDENTEICVSDAA